MKINSFTQKSAVEILDNGLTREDLRRRGYLSIAADCLDNLIQYGTELYGRSLSFFLCLYRDTGEAAYLAKARAFADQAVMKLYYDGLFRGQPARNCHCNVVGVGFLVYSLLQLHVVEHFRPQDFGEYVDIDNY